MSDNLDSSRLNDFIERLRDQAKVEKNDVRHRHYAGYINTFVSYFGNEKVYLVGSTAENLKLRWSKDGGDADFLLCSGEFEIPVENLVFREDTPCFVWIKADGLKSKIKFDLVDGHYIPTEMLRKVSPELFTILRGIYLIVTSTLDTIPGRKSRVTTTALSSRVGLAKTEYRNLIVSDDRISDPKQRKSNYKRRRTNKQRSDIAYLKDVAIHPKDKQMIDLIINVIVLAKKPGSSGSRDGQFGNFSHVMSLVQRRRQTGSETTKVLYDREVEGGVTYVNDLSDDSDVDMASGEAIGGVKRIRDSAGKRDFVDFGSKPSDIEGTYEEKTSKDFVPALRVTGQLRIMVDWKNRGGFWPKPADRNRIANCEVFVVSRYAPVSPDTDKDFCLSFNQSEMELARCLSEVQRDVFLILKSYLKGGFQTTHDEKSASEMKLKTFHLKTALYWVSEKEDTSLWEEGNIIQAVKKVLMFISDALNKTRLDHYFIPANNLFAGLQKTTRDSIKECIDAALKDPVNYIQHFFDLDDGKPVPIRLSEDEVETLLDMKEDGGLEKQTDVVEEAIANIHRGFSVGLRDAAGNAPIVEAIRATWNQFLQDVERGELADLQNKRDLEQAKTQITTLLATLQLTQATNTTGVLSDFVGSVGNLLGGAATAQTQNPRTDNHTRDPEDYRESSGHGSSQSGIPKTTPLSSRENVDPETVQNNEGADLLTGALGLLANSQNMDRESRRRAEDELKYKAMSFFFGKPF